MMDLGVGNNLGLDARVAGMGQVGCWQIPARTGRKSWGCQVRGGESCGRWGSCCKGCSTCREHRQKETAIRKELSQGQSRVSSRSPLDTSWVHASGQHGRRHKQELQRQLLIFTGLILAASPPAGPQRKRLR